MNEKLCRHCNCSLPLSLFYQKSKGGYWPYCKPCESLRKKQQLINFKKQCLEYKQVFGCILCGYNKNLTALDFHHTNPAEKDFTISSRGQLKLNDKIKSELDKCDVLCSNCHREKHSLKGGNFSPKCLMPSSPTYCVDCNSCCSKKASRCQDCHNKFKLKSSRRPSKQQLEQDLISIKHFTRIGKKYEVSDNAVRKWCKSYNISMA